MEREYGIKLQNASLLIMRLVIAAVFLFAAWAKWRFISADPTGGGQAGLIWFLIIVEPLGALGLALGLLNRWAASGLAIIMVGAIVVTRLTYGAGFFTDQNGTGLDYNFLILAGCLVLATFGAGRWSLDALRKK